MSKIGADPPTNSNDASRLVNSTSAITIAGVHAAVLNRAVPDIALSGAYA
jgi:hypothetical protein